MAKKKKSRKSKHKAPVLLIGWGREGVKDVAYACEEFPFDRGLDCIDAQGASNDDVLRAIENWLEANPNAQFLYIGCHGDEDGLSPIVGADRLTQLITWPALGKVLSKARARITVWLGACSSSFAATNWNSNANLLVNPIVGFSEDTNTKELKQVLKELIKRTGVETQELSGKVGDLGLLDEDLAELQQRYDKITMHYRVPGHGYVDCANFKNAVGVELPEYLDEQCDKKQVRRLCADVKRGLAVIDERDLLPPKEPSPDPNRQELTLRKLKPVNQRRKKRR